MEMNKLHNKAEGVANWKISNAPQHSAERIEQLLEQISRLKRNGGDLRGKSADRKARKIRMMQDFGDGTTCACVYCGHLLTADTAEADRILIPEEGGDYCWLNVMPACKPCNNHRGNQSLAGQLLGDGHVIQPANLPRNARHLAPAEVA